jgi:hypothetical protein
MSDAVELVRENESQCCCSNFSKGSAKRYVYNCRHLPFENANRDVAIVQAGLNFCCGSAPLTGIPATHPNPCSDHVDVSNYLMGLAVAHLAWFHFFTVGPVVVGQEFPDNSDSFSLAELVITNRASACQHKILEI